MELDLLVHVRLQWQPAAAPESASSRDVMDSPDSSSDGVEEVVRPHSVGGDDSVIVLSSVVDLSSTSSVVVSASVPSSVACKENGSATPRHRLHSDRQSMPCTAVEERRRRGVRTRVPPKQRRCAGVNAVEGGR